MSLSKSTARSQDPSPERKHNSKINLVRISRQF